MGKEFKLLLVVIATSISLGIFIYPTPKEQKSRLDKAGVDYVDLLPE